MARISGNRLLSSLVLALGLLAASLFFGDAMITPAMSLLAAVASGAGTWISASWVLSRREPPSLHDIVHHDLVLSPEQLTRFEAVEARFAAARRVEEPFVGVFDAQFRFGARLREKEIRVGVRRAGASAEQDERK